MERLVETGTVYASMASDSFEETNDELRSKATSVKEEVKDSAINTIEQA